MRKWSPCLQWRISIRSKYLASWRNKNPSSWVRRLHPTITRCLSPLSDCRRPRKAENMCSGRTDLCEKCERRKDCSLGARTAPNMEEDSLNKTGHERDNTSSSGRTMGSRATKKSPGGNVIVHEQSCVHLASMSGNVRGNFHEPQWSIVRLCRDGKTLSSTSARSVMSRTRRELQFGALTWPSGGVSATR